MTVPTNPKLRQTAGLVDKVGNFGSFPPTEGYRDKFKGQGVLLNVTDPDCSAAQIAGIRSHGVWAGVWHPVPPASDSGVARARWLDAKLDALDTSLVAIGQPKLDVVWLNFEGYTISQWRSFLWGEPPALPGQMIMGWRGTNGAIGSTGGFRPGFSTGVVDEPFKDGSVKPMKDLMTARVMLGIEGFYGPTPQWPDMTPADHLRAYIDRITGFRSDGTVHADEAWPVEQVVGCYDAALGAVVSPHQPLLLRGGLHFTLERARQVGLL